MKKKVTTQSLRAGQTIYKVYKVGAESWIRTMVVLGKPYTDEYGSPYLRVAVTLEGALSSKEDIVCECIISLQDAGIISNGYNDHKTFYSKKKAISYLNIPNEDPSLRMACLQQATRRVVQELSNVWAQPLTAIQALDS